MNIRTTLIAFSASAFLASQVAAQTGNTTHGSGAGSSLTTGDNNTLVGDAAGTLISVASDDVMVGQGAGSTLTNHYDNTYVGARAGATGAGLNNVFVGSEAGESNTASKNTFLGEQAGRFNTTGEENTFVGDEAGREHATGRNNVFLGARAGRGFNAVAGSYNVAVGGESVAFDVEHEGVWVCSGSIAAGYWLTTGFANTLVGGGAGGEVQDGVGNTMIGHTAGTRAHSSDFNTFVGCQAGHFNNVSGHPSNGSRNTYFGFGAGEVDRDGENNVSIGCFAASGHLNRRRCTFLGAESDVGGNDCVAVGYRADANGNNSVAIGAYTSTFASNEVAIGNDSTTSIGGPVNWTALSDGRVKTDVAYDVPGLDFVRDLRPVTYEIDVEKAYALRGAVVPDALRGRASNSRSTGFLAQDVESAAGANGFDFSGVRVPAGEGDRYGLRYAEFVAPLVRTVQELDEKVVAQRALIRRQAAALRRFERVLAGFSISAD